MAGIEGIEQCACLDAADFPQNDSVRSRAKGYLQEIVECDICFECLRLAFEGKDVRLSDQKFRRVLDGDDALLFRNRLSEDVQQGGLPGSRSTAHQQCLPRANLILKEVRKRTR